MMVTLGKKGVGAFLPQIEPTVLRGSRKLIGLECYVAYFESKYFSRNKEANKIALTESKTHGFLK